MRALLDSAQEGRDDMEGIRYRFPSMHPWVMLLLLSFCALWTQEHQVLEHLTARRGHIARGAHHG